MAEKFDIAEHIKVQALGYRKGEIVSDTQFRVNSKLYNQEDYTLVGDYTISATELTPEVRQDPQYAVLVGNSDVTLILNATGTANVGWVFKDVEVPTNIINLEYLNSIKDFTYSGDAASITTAFESNQMQLSVFDFRVYNTTGPYPPVFEPYDSNGYWAFTNKIVNNSGLGILLDTPVWVNGSIQYPQPIEPKAEYLGNRSYKITFYGHNYMKKNVGVSYIDKYLIGYGPSNAPTYPQHYVTPQLETFGGYSFEREYSVILTDVDPNASRITVNALFTNSTIQGVEEFYLGPETIQTGTITTLTTDKPTYALDESFNAKYRYDWDGNTNQFTWQTTAGETPGSSENPGCQGYKLYYLESASDDFSPSDSPIDTGTLLASYSDPTADTLNSDALPSGKYSLVAAYREMYSDYNPVITYEILRSDLVSSVSATYDKVADRMTITSEVAYRFPGASPNPRAYIYRDGAGSQDYFDILTEPDTWVSQPLPVSGGDPRFPGGPADSYTVQIPDSNGTLTIAARVTVVKEVITEFQEIGRLVVSKDATSIGYPSSGTPALLTSTGANQYRYRALSEPGTYYVGISESSSHPLYDFTVQNGLIEVTITNVPDTDFRLNVFDASGIVRAQVDVGDIYGFDFVEPEYPVTAYGWWPIECAVSSLDINTSVDIEKGLLKRPEPGTCSIVMKGIEGDPRGNTALRIDNKIRVQLDAAASPSDAKEALFYGFIESVSTTYDTFGNVITNLNAIDAMSRVMNVNIPIYEYANDESFSRRMYNLFNDYIGPATSGVSYDSTVWQILESSDGSRFPPEYREDVSSSELITELTEGEYATMAQSRGGVVFWWNRAAPAAFIDASTATGEPSYYGFSTVHNEDSLDHFCISDFTVTNSIEDITNKVVAKLSYDDLTEHVYTDPTSIGIYGERAFEVDLNLDAPDGDPSFYLRKWTEEVPYSEDRPELESITTSVVNRKGLVTNAFLYDINLDLMRVFIQVGTVDVNGVYFAQNIRHRITPNNWTMEIDLTAD